MAAARTGAVARTAAGTVAGARTGTAGAGRGAAGAGAGRRRAGSGRGGEERRGIEHDGRVVAYRRAAVGRQVIPADLVLVFVADQRPVGDEVLRLDEERRIARGQHRHFVIGQGRVPDGDLGDPAAEVENGIHVAADLYVGRIGRRQVRRFRVLAGRVDPHGAAVGRRPHPGQVVPRIDRDLSRCLGVSGTAPGLGVGAGLVRRAAVGEQQEIIVVVVEDRHDDLVAGQVVDVDPSGNAERRAGDRRSSA